MRDDVVIRAGKAGRVLLAGLLLAVMTGCGGDDDDSPAADTTADTTAVQCDQMWADGAVMTREGFQAAYCERAGDLLRPATTTRPCVDGRILFWNSEAWGYFGEPMTRQQPGAPAAAPEDVLKACKGASG